MLFINDCVLIYLCLKVKNYQYLGNSSPTKHNMQIVADDILKLILFLRENKTADNSHEMSSLIFSQKSTSKCGLGQK